jgi:hypothetical protein
VNLLAVRVTCSLGWLLLLSSCAWSGLVPDPHRCLVVPVESQLLPSDLSLRARMTIEARGHEVGFDVIARTDRGDLVVVGISESGPRLFAVRQTHREIDVESLASELDRVALWVMDALHRALWIEAPPHGDNAGTLRWEHDGELIVETLTEGHRQRQFVSADDHSSGEPVSIDYADASSIALRTPIHVRNPSCGYQATIVVLEWTGLARAHQLDATPAAPNAAVVGSAVVSRR